MEQTLLIPDLERNLRKDKANGRQIYGSERTRFVRLAAPPEAPVRRLSVETGKGIASPCSAHAKFWEFMKACLYCTRITKSKTSLCGICWKILEDQIQETNSHMDGLQLKFLWNWRREIMHNHLSYALKTTQNPRLWLRFAELFLLHANGTYCEKTMVLVPSPPPQALQVDHASRFAIALSFLTGMKVVSCLERLKNNESQKTQGRENRLKRRLETNKYLSHIKGLTPIFVDDIVTTGGTAGAARKAMKLKEPLQVWTLYCRPRHTLV